MACWHLLPRAQLVVSAAAKGRLAPSSSHITSCVEREPAGTANCLPPNTLPIHSRNVSKLILTFLALATSFCSVSPTSHSDWNGQTQRCDVAHNLLSHLITGEAREDWGTSNVNVIAKDSHRCSPRHSQRSRRSRHLLGCHRTPHVLGLWVGRVMKPITYFSGLSTVIGEIYLWFLYQGREVSYSSVLDRSISARHNALYRARGFDLGRWQELNRESKALRNEIT
ncbi:hypothetical protein B0F90DRAFT_1818762 [Multifurca ochricompacta]|uniref:Calcium uniporter protein, mitochondrial n=1 Tax=Multifurca ochricompacta TaxID=376703 RepID=A0AAD4M1I6_9AGAM|nr:hypothetical protein B0F90DRAFT_1818762 [Multifurca ochricompacta]